MVILRSYYTPKTEKQSLSLVFSNQKFNIVIKATQCFEKGFSYQDYE